MSQTTKPDLPVQELHPEILLAVQPPTPEKVGDAKDKEGAAGPAIQTVKNIISPTFTRIDQWFSERTTQTQRRISLVVVVILAVGLGAYAAHELFGKKYMDAGGPPAPIINTNTNTNHINFKLNFDDILRAREGGNQPNAPNGGQRSYNLPKWNLDELEKFLASSRSTPPRQLSVEDKAACLYAAAVLSINGRNVPDLDYWLDADLIDSVEKSVIDKVKVTKDAVADALNQSAAILVAADQAFEKRNLTRAIDLYKRYIHLLGLVPAFSDSEVMSTYRKNQVILAAEEKLGLAYIDEAENLIHQNRLEEGEKLRGEAFNLYARVAENQKGSLVSIVPDKQNRPKGWYIHTQAGTAGVSVVRGPNDRYAIRMTNQGSSSFFAATLVEVNAPSDYRLKWRWKLMKMLPGNRQKDTGFSANHPLSMTVAFLTSENKIVAIHYVIDPLEPVGTRWLDKENGIVKLGVAKFQLWYPYVVVSDGTLPLGQWRDYEVNPAADYKSFAKENPQVFGTGDVPPIRGIVVESNCQLPEGGQQKNLAEGEVSDIRLEPVADPKPGKLGP